MPRPAVDTLAAVGQLSNTYIIYTSDNGFQLGNHQQASGKQFHWEEVVRVPFYIKGEREGGGPFPSRVSASWGPEGLGWGHNH